MFGTFTIWDDGVAMHKFGLNKTSDILTTITIYGLFPGLVHFDVFLFYSENETIFIKLKGVHRGSKGDELKFAHSKNTIHSMVNSNMFCHVPCM